MNKLKKFDLGKEAIEYIKTCLIDSGKPVSKGLLDLPLEKGRSITYLPYNVSTESLLDFKSGGIILSLPTEDKNIDFVGSYVYAEEVLNFIKEKLEKQQNSYLIYEDTICLSTDKWISKEKPSILSFENNVYHFLNSKKANNQSIKNLIKKSSNAWLTIGMITFLDKDLEVKEGQDLSIDIIQKFIKNTQYILVSAYDGESTIIWCKQ